jgi:hypothetical protein
VAALAVERAEELGMEESGAAEVDAGAAAAEEEEVVASAAVSPVAAEEGVAQGTCAGRILQST